jgi:hypothetical protein
MVMSPPTIQVAKGMGLIKNGFLDKSGSGGLDKSIIPFSLFFMFH